MKTLGRLLASWFLAFSLNGGGAESLSLNSRKQERKAGTTNQWLVIEKESQINPKKTAIIICDMWDKHWCKGATERVGEIAPRMNEVIQAARAKGILIIHAPSDTMEYYKDHPQRKKAMAVKHSAAPADIGKWRSLNQQKEGPLPIDDSDGGCDDLPQCANYKAWKKQIDLLEVKGEDYITDRGDEVYNILQEHGIDTVILVGVHTNMCVLGRPFSIRQMVSLGKATFLVRDMTDTMYNSRKAPFVSHFAGTDLVVGHIEKHWCPTITSVDLAGGKPFRFKEDKRKKVALILGENEYKTWETLPAFAEQELKSRGLKIEMVQSSTNNADHHFKNIEAIKEADLLLLSVRRRSPPVEMLEYIREHLAAGKAIVGIRTANHPFALKFGASELPTDPKLGVWNDFDGEVLGGHYTGHYKLGEPLKIELSPEAGQHPILKGVALRNLATYGTLYKVHPLKEGTTPLLLATLGQNPPETIAWTRVYGPNKARIFYTSMGHFDDFQNEPFRQLLLNAVLWGLDMPVQ